MRDLQSTMESNNNNSPIVQFFDNKTVFITGATGFMGKVRQFCIVCLENDVMN